MTHEDDVRLDLVEFAGAYMFGARAPQAAALIAALVAEHEAWVVDPEGDDEHTLAWLKVDGMLHDE